MKVAVTGSRGLIGTELVRQLGAQSHEVVRIVRGPAGPGDMTWDPENGVLRSSDLQGIDAVVHLAGAGVGDRRWSARYKQLILSSRVTGTAALATALAEMPSPPRVLVSASAVGYYGQRGDEQLTEGSEPGTGFLAGVCAQWEAATFPASSAGIRVVMTRTGVVLSASGGALKKQLPLFKFGLGARLGDGRQQFSWITRRDVVAGICFLIEHEEIAGPVNLTAPQPVTNAEFTRALARAVHRPAKLAVPRAILRLGAGSEMATEFFLASQRVVPQRLRDAWFSFKDPELQGALKVALRDQPKTALSNT
jgi:uncharacterized protein (TIGR01777 family)